MNRILGQKLSIVTAKPQTTRQRICGIKTAEEGQVIYVDTPGIHRARGQRAEPLHEPCCARCTA